jgi:hypothetical protein
MLPIEDETGVALADATLKKSVARRLSAASPEPRKMSDGDTGIDVVPAVQRIATSSVPSSSSAIGSSRSPSTMPRARRL